MLDAFGNQVEISENSDSTCVIATLNIGLTSVEIQSQARQSGVRLFPIQKSSISSALLSDCMYIFGIGELTNARIKVSVKL